MNETISVIVPVYNAEKFIERCVSSILNQTYQDIELILVNDGSQDDSLAVCHKIAREDSRVIVLDKPNGGAASARNMGLNYAAGSYIGFCDADDYLDYDMYSTLKRVLDDNNLDVIDSLAKDFGANGELLFCGDQSRDIEFVPVESAIKDILKRTGNVSLCTRLFRKSAIGDLRIPEGRRVEDFYFTICFMTRQQYNVIYHYPFYNCVVNSYSVTRSATGSIYLDALYFYELAMELLKNYDFDLEYEQQYYLLKMYYLLSISATKKERKINAIQIRKCQKDLRKHCISIIKNPYLKRKERVMLFVACVSMGIARKLYLIKNRGK